MEWLPALRLDVENVALPPFNTPLPRVLSPSKNVTVPVAAEGATVAVKVTDCPTVDGCRLEVRVVVLAFTICVNVPEELAYVESPP